LTLPLLKNRGFLLSVVDSHTSAASKLLSSSGIELTETFPTEVDDGFRWGVARLPRPSGTATFEILVGVPATGRFAAQELVDAILDGIEDLQALGDDEDLEIGSFRFEIY